MKITKAWLTRRNACSPGMDFVTEKKLIGLDADVFIKQLIKHDKLGWANWLIAQGLNRPNRIRYACFAARDVLVSKSHTAYKASVTAIEAAEKCIDSNTKANRDTARAAADAADAADAAYAAAAADTLALKRYIKFGLKLLKEQEQTK